MGRILYISDTHFGHTNMALKRGFSSSEEMDEHIVQKWNSKVLKKDTVFILGDITMERPNYEILNRLNGYKKIVLGNHDKPQHIPKLLLHVNSVCGMFKKGNIIMTHCPIHESELGRFSHNMHGHVHELTLDDDRYINVSCEAVNYTPMLLEELISQKRIKTIVYSE
jgi:calcineurin-like phosphoesterase family protein